MIRQSLCNVIAASVQEALDFDPVGDLDARTLAQRTWAEVDVAASPDGTKWDRYTDVELSPAEVDYVVRRVEGN